MEPIFQMIQTRKNSQKIDGMFYSSTVSDPVSILLKLITKLKAWGHEKFFHVGAMQHAPSHQHKKKSPRTASCFPLKANDSIEFFIARKYV